MTSSGAKRRPHKADRLPEFPPDNELPATLDVGPFIWRSPDVGITATGFLVYSTAVAFTLVALSKGVSLQGDRSAGSLRFGAHAVPVTFHGVSRGENSLKIEAWTPFPPDGDLVFYLEWPAEGIEYSEFRVPRSAAEKAVVLWPPELLADRHRRHVELAPNFLVQVEPWAEGSDLMRLRIVQQGPPSIDHLDTLALSICNDDSYWPNERNVIANGHNYDEVRNLVWAPYRFTPGTGPGEARADIHGRATAYEAPLPAGEELAFLLEPTRPGTWTGGMTQEEWQRQRGNVIRLAITATKRDHGTWHLGGEINVAAGAVLSTFVSESGSRSVPPGEPAMDRDTPAP